MGLLLIFLIRTQNEQDCFALLAFINIFGDELIAAVLLHVPHIFVNEFLPDPLV